MKIGLFIDNVAPAIGGGYTFVVELLSALHQLKDGCEHEFVLCYRRGGEHVARLFPEFQTLALDAHRAAVLSPREKVFQHFPEIVERIYCAIFRVPSKVRWDERIYTREGIDFLIRIDPWSAMTMNIPYATVLWDLQHRNNPWFPEVCALGEWERRESNFSLLVRRASLIYTGTQRGRQEVESYYQVPSERIKVLPFSTPQFALAASDKPKNPEALRKLGVPTDYLFYPAQFWPHKNHVTVLEACKLIREQTGWDLGLVFTGSDQGNLNYVRHYTQKLGLERSTVFLGFIEQTELIELYKGAFCLVYPTFCGPDNLPPLEAFALNCPVVASAVPGALEQLGDAALLVQPFDERAFADAILSLRDSNLRARMIDAGRTRALQNSWESYAQGVINSLNEFARTRRAWP
jgi:glycosyltransferase involved in cell wall biosynthesis